MVNITESTAANVRGFMAQRGLTQREVGIALSLSQQAVSDRLTGRVRWSLYELDELADLLAVSFAMLVQARAVPA
jgi:transcriptional regulator with XRE-family HTH domain